MTDAPTSLTGEITPREHCGDHFTLANGDQVRCADPAGHLDRLRAMESPQPLPHSDGTHTWYEVGAARYEFTILPPGVVPAPPVVRPRSAG
jgi:hypothetical protein